MSDVPRQEPSCIDRTLKDFGMAIGPNAVGDLAGWSER